MKNCSKTKKRWYCIVTKKFLKSATKLFELNSNKLLFLNNFQKISTFYFWWFVAWIGCTWGLPWICIDSKEVMKSNFVPCCPWFWIPAFAWLTLGRREWHYAGGNDKIILYVFRRNYIYACTGPASWIVCGSCEALSDISSHRNLCEAR